ncbi:hypothetical protein ES708_02359 [subsurface metagenome]
MAYLMHICFDNSSVLNKNVYYFQYNGIRYKLIQNNSSKWSDVLLTIIPTNNKQREDEAFQAASDFFSSLAWQHDSMLKLWDSGGKGVPDNYSLRNAKSCVFDFHKISLAGHYLGGRNLFPIPEIENDDQRTALLLYREANSSNNLYLSFLFYWQIMETGGTEAIGWINKTFRKNSISKQITKDEINCLPLKGKTLGNYFNDDCRNAIAHIKRKTKGKTSIKLDNPEDMTRIAISTRIIKKFARTYINKHLNLNKRLYLARRGKGFPTIVKYEDLLTKPYSIIHEKSSY